MNFICGEIVGRRREFSDFQECPLYDQFSPRCRKLQMVHGDISELVESFLARRANALRTVPKGTRSARSYGHFCGSVEKRMTARVSANRRLLCVFILIERILFSKGISKMHVWSMPRDSFGISHSRYAKLYLYVAIKRSS